VAQLAKDIVAFEPVVIVARPGDEAGARAMCGDVGEIVALAHDTMRLRDIGPAFLVDGKGGAAAADWRFNQWGERAAVSQADEIFGHSLLGFAEVRRFRAPLTLEPGSYVGDGSDTLIALAPAVFDPARNPRLERLEAFAFFRHWLGMSRVIWLEDAHPADPLFADIRALVSFVQPSLALVTYADDQPTLRRVAEALAKARDAQGKNLVLVPLPAPPQPRDCTAPLSYTTYLPVNGAVFVPAYDAATDDEVAEIFARLFPDRAIHFVPALAFAQAGVTLSSLAIPQPARLLERDRATVLPRSAWSQQAPDVDAMLQKYIDLAEKDGN
jgi:agmatine deiminase